MIKQVNPRAAMFQALHVTADVLNEAKLFALAVFLDPRYSAKIDLIEPDPSGQPTAATFRYNQQLHRVSLGQVIVKERKSGQIRIHSAKDFQDLYEVYPTPAAGEIKKLSDFLLNYFPGEIGRPMEDGKPAETAADIVLSLLNQPMIRTFIKGVRQIQTTDKGSEAIRKLGDISTMAANIERALSQPVPKWDLGGDVACNAMVGEQMAIQCPACGMVTVSNNGAVGPHNCRFNPVANAGHNNYFAGPDAGKSMGPHTIVIPDALTGSALNDSDTPARNKENLDLGQSTII
jgi:hypothetical protein